MAFIDIDSVIGELRPNDNAFMHSKGIYKDVVIHIKGFRLEIRVLWITYYLVGFKGTIGSNKVYNLFPSQMYAQNFASTNIRVML